MCGSGCRKKRKLTEAEKALVVENQRLVRHVVYQMVNSGLLKRGHEDDDMQDAMFGLMQAAQMYDADKGVKFSTYAATCIRNELLAREQKRRRQRRSAECISLDEPPPKDRPYEELIAGADDTENILNDLADRVIERLRALGRDRTADIVDMYANAGMRMDEIAQELGITKQAVSNQLKRARPLVEDVRNER